MTRGLGGHSPANILHYLAGIDFPANKQDLVETAREHGADEDILECVEALPDEDYYNMADVMSGYGRADRSSGACGRQMPEEEAAGGERPRRRGGRGGSDRGDWQPMEEEFRGGEMYGQKQPYRDQDEYEGDGEGRYTGYGSGGHASMFDEEEARYGEGGGYERRSRPSGGGRGSSYGGRGGGYGGSSGRDYGGRSQRGGGSSRGRR